MALSRRSVELPPRQDGAAHTAEPDPSYFEREMALLGELESTALPILGDLSLAAPGPGGANADAMSAGLLESVLFLRLAEERGLAARGALAAVAGGPNVGAALASLLANAAERCDIPGLAPATNAAGDHALSHPNQDALRVLLERVAKGDDFRDLRPGALGRLYERSLAARSPRGPHTAGARAAARTRRVRREKRKTHGVFYTPSHLVDYIVARTLGPAIEGRENDGAPVRVLDPACGSGAFLLGAYEYLLAERRARNGAALTTEERTAILERAIFGVDVDRAALEVAKMSLVLTCFDGHEPSAHDAPNGAVPRLAQNLCRGHSLLDVDWKGGGASPLVWERVFPDAFADGGFDVVIGNPPYLSFGGRHAVEISDELRRYYADHYESGGWPTAHSLFLERAVKLLSRRFVSFVVPDQVGHLAGYRSARAIAQREAGVVEVRYWGERVFRGVTTPALTIVLDKQRKGARTELVDRDGAASDAAFEPGEAWTSSPARALIDRLRARSFSLEKLVGDCGIRTTAAKAQVVDWPGPEGSVVPVLEGRLVGRYGCKPPSSAVRLDSKEPLFMSKKERYEAVRFVIRQTASYPIVGPREHAVYFRNSLLALFSPSGDVDVHYLVALLNSKLLRFVYTETVREAQQRTFPQVKVKALQSLPLREVRPGDPGDRMRHDALVDLARAALDAQKRIFAARGTAEEASQASEFERIDGAIDEAVFDLYDLSPSDRHTVEQSLARAAL